MLPGDEPEAIGQLSGPAVTMVLSQVVTNLAFELDFLFILCINNVSQCYMISEEFLENLRCTAHTILQGVFCPYPLSIIDRSIQV